MNSHRERREALAAYVLGALDPAERRAVDAHLQSCADCRDEVADLAALPPLLGRLRPEEAASALSPPAPPMLSDTLTRVAHERRRARRELWGWRAAAVVAVLAGVVLWQPWASPPRLDSVQAEVRPVVAAAAETSGVADAYAWEWGTTVQLDLQRLPAREGYVLWAVAEDGTRQQAGAWGPTSEGRALVRGASAIQRDDLARVEVTDMLGEMLLVFSFD